MFVGRVSQLVSTAPETESRLPFLSDCCPIAVVWLGWMLHSSPYGAAIWIRDPQR